MPFVMTNGINMFYQVRGRGEPLVLLMGLGVDGSLWEDHVRAYEREFECIVVDNRGAGRSDAPSGPYSTRQMADDVAGLIHELGLRRAHVAGISMGSAIAQELALTHPEMVKSLILVSSWDICDSYTTRIFETFRSMIEMVDRITFNRLLQLWIFSPEWHQNHMHDLLVREEAVKQNPRPMSAQAFQAQCDACMSHRTRGRLNQIVVPALITAGELDIFTPVHYSRTMAEEMPNARLVVMENSAHAHHWERLNEFNQLTLEFLLSQKGDNL
ncbi:MAG: alpha/beta hydrolase [Alicyclobacillus sp.]|nr:alpha/beta hydrolase [Alicyclobacillus sp.]